MTATTLFPKEIKASKCAIFLYILLFPWFFIYNFLSAKIGVSLPLIGGGYSIYCLLFLPIMLIFIARTFSTKMPMLHHLSLAFFALILITPFAWLALTGKEAALLNIPEISITHTASLMALYFIGLFLPLANKRLIKTNKAIFYLMCAIVIFNVMTNNSVSFTPISSWSEEHVTTASYQGYARSISVTLLIALFFSNSVPSKLFVAIVGIITLFFIGARSELYGTALSLLAIILFWSLRSYKWLSCAILAMFILSIAITFNLETILKSRQALVFTGLEGTSSWDARESMIQIAFEQIYTSPLVGDYKSYEDFGSGSYAHNILSAWVDFGLAGFLLYLTLIVVALYISAIKFINYDGRHAGWGLCLAFSLMTFILSFIAKSVYWEIPALAFGLVVSMQVRERYRHQMLVPVYSQTAT